jgi:hypothetical protein
VGPHQGHPSDAAVSGLIKHVGTHLFLPLLRPPAARRPTVTAVEEATAKGDGPTVLRHLKAAGQWTLGIAEKIGVGLAVEASKRAMLGGS